jgi:YVTN family beta-propeller protein
MKTKAFHLGLAITVTIIFSSCKKDKLDEIYGGYPVEIGNIVKNKCATSGCHFINDEHDHHSHSGHSHGDNSTILNLRTWEDLFKGGMHGTVVYPFNSKFSPLFHHINTFPELGMMASPTMPLNRPPLSKEEVLKIKNWIDNGAPDINGNVFGSNVYDKIYVVNQGCDVITVFDAKTKLPIRMIEVGSNPNVLETPHFINFSPDGKYWYVVFINSPYLEKYDANTDKLVARCNLDNQIDWNRIIITNDGKKGFCVAWTANGRVFSVDLEKMQVINRMYGLYFPHGTALSKNNDTLYIAAQTGNFFMKIDTALTTHIDIPIDNSGSINYSSSLDAHDIFVSPDGTKLYFSCQKSNEIREFDLTTNSVSHIIPVGKFPQAMAYSSKYNTLYVSCQLDQNPDGVNEGSVVAINLNTYTTQKVYVGNQPHGLCIDEQNDLLYVPSRNLTGSGVPPHHSSVCNGRNGFVSIIKLPDLSILKDNIELSVDTYFAKTRP